MARAWRGGLLWPTVAAVVVLAVLVSLGTWQWRRMIWKEGLIAQIAARIHAPPIPIAEALRRAAAGEDIEYLRVTATGRFRHDGERLLWAPSRLGPGWNVLTPLTPETGRSVIVNRGFVADTDRDRGRRPEPEAETVTVTGLMRRPEEHRMFTPDNEPARNIWYWRDLDAMKASLPGVPGPSVVPYFLDAEARSAADVAAAPKAPRGGATLIDLPNSHFQYAMTWYGLALTLVGVYVAFAWPRLRGSRGTQETET